MNDINLPERLLRFSTDVKNMLRSLAGEGDLKIICDQLIKSSTLALTSYKEAQTSGSGSVYGIKIGTSLKEMRESNYLLRILSTKYQGNSEIELLIKASNELKSILISINVSVTMEN
jgi:four helix bundle protein